MTAKLQILELSNRGDERGFSFSVPVEALAFVGPTADIHIVAAKPGAVRGNHCHSQWREALVILPGSKWSLHWDDGEGPATQHREFSGDGAVLVLVPAGAAHAVRNHGAADLWMVAVSSEPYNPSETVKRKLI